jgi:hypothetical protein
MFSKKQANKYIHFPDDSPPNDKSVSLTFINIITLW